MGLWMMVLAFYEHMGVVVLRSRVGGGTGLAGLLQVRMLLEVKLLLKLRLMTMLMKRKVLQELNLQLEQQGLNLHSWP